MKGDFAPILAASALCIVVLAGLTAIDKNAAAKAMDSMVLYTTPQAHQPDQSTPTSTGGTVAHSKQEERRPGIKAIFDEIKKLQPGKSNSHIAGLAKVEWQKRFGPCTGAGRNKLAPTAPAISKPV